MANRPHVALLIKSSEMYGRGLLPGIIAYLRSHERWAIYLHEQGNADPPPRWLRRWRGDGIIVQPVTAQVARAVLAKRLPTVALFIWPVKQPVPLLKIDNAAVARLATEHLLQRGLRRFAFCGFAGAYYSDRRCRLFTATVAQAGYDCHIYESPRRPPRLRRGVDAQQGLLYEAELARWLARLPKPIGLLACNDIRGQQVLNACREIDIAVPGEIAVIGVDNDAFLCDLCDPPLTSVVLDWERAGYEAAALLAQRMARRAPSTAGITIEPKGVVTRASTDVLKIEDPNIVQAVRFIQEHACSGISVEDILAAVPLSRRSLERRFTQWLGCSPKAEILRLQFQRVTTLLTETDFPLAAIAAQAGFRYLEYLSSAFKKRFGLTLGQYRSRSRYRQTPTAAE